MDPNAFTARTVIFSSYDETKTEIQLGTSKNAAQAVKETAKWDNRYSLQANLFQVTHGGRLPENAGELMEWLQEMQQQYTQLTQKRYDHQLTSSRNDFLRWLQDMAIFHDAEMMEAAWREETAAE